jgi:thiol-disulfide isomerase/thioredoxin
MKKKYVLFALITLLVGAVSVWVIIDRLPDWMGTTKNQHLFIDRLEKEGAIEFAGKTLEGQSFNLEQFKGKLVILSFWASWCAPCVEEFPSMVSLLKQNPDKVVMVAVSSDYSREDIDVFFKSLNLSEKLPNLYVTWDPDHAISQKYEVQRLPESFIFGKDMKLLRKVVGSIKWDDQDAMSFFNSHSM